MAKVRKIQSTNTVNVTALKARLSKFLRAAKSGLEIIVTEHSVPVAKIIAFKNSTVQGLIACEPSQALATLVNMTKSEGTVIQNFNSTAIITEDRQKR